MSESDLLIGFAQIAVGIAGFAGIVAALSTRLGAWEPLDRWRLVSQLRASFSTVVLALLPLVIHAAGLSGSGLWRLCSGLYVVYYVHGLFSFRKGVRLAAAHPGPASRGLAIALLSGESVAAGLQLINLIWLRTPWPYLAALLWGLIFSFVVFAELLLLSLPRRGGPPAA